VPVTLATLFAFSDILADSLELFGTDFVTLHPQVKLYPHVQLCAICIDTYFLLQYLGETLSSTGMSCFVLLKFGFYLFNLFSKFPYFGEILEQWSSLVFYPISSYL
jgi:hypothetical protein